MKLFKRKDKKMYYPRNYVMFLHKAYILSIISLILYIFVGCQAFNEYQKLKDSMVIKTPVANAYAKVKKEGLKQKEKKQLTTKEVEQQIRKIARENKFKWVDYLVRLAKCESTLNANAINDNGVYGIDRGVFQINDYYHPEVSDECAFDVRCATEWTMWRINNGYQHEWHCDKIIK